MQDAKEIDRKVEINILAFVKDGKFDVLKTGQTRDWVLNNFPIPDDFDNGESYKHGEFEIFNYGDFELHFFRDTLYLIFADYKGAINAGTSLLLTHKWIFEKDTSDLNFPYVIEALKKENIDFTTQKNDTLYSVTLHLKSKVDLHFESDNSYELQNYHFVAFWITDRALLNA